MNAQITLANDCKIKCEKEIRDLLQSSNSKQGLSCSENECNKCVTDFWDPYNVCKLCKVIETTQKLPGKEKETITEYDCVDCDISYSKRMVHVFPKNNGTVFEKCEFCSKINADWSECTNSPYQDTVTSNYQNNYTVVGCRSSQGSYKSKTDFQVIDPFLMTKDPYKKKYTPFCCPYGCQSCSILIEENEKYYFYDEAENGKITALQYDKLKTEFFAKISQKIICDSCPENREKNDNKCQCKAGYFEDPFTSVCVLGNPACAQGIKSDKCCKNEKCQTCLEDGITCITCKQADSLFRGVPPNCDCLSGSYLYSSINDQGVSIQTGGCEPCPVGKYNFEKNAKECKECPNGPFKCMGGQNMEIQPGYWRKQKQSIKFQQCVDNNENCIGGQEGGDKICKKGYIGANCETCDLKGSPSYTFNGDLKCTQCSESIIKEPVIFAILVYRLFSLFIAVSGSLSAVEDKVGFNSLRILFNTHSPTPNQTGILMKILINYLFIIGIIAAFQLDVSGELKIFIQAVSNPLKILSYGFDCYTIDYATIPNVYFRVLWQMVIIFIELVIIGAAFFVVKKFENNKTSVKAFFSTVFLYQFFTNSPLLIQMILETLACRTVAEEQYLLADLTTKCGDSKYNAYKFGYQIISLIFWGVVIYVFLLYKLRMHYHKIPDEYRTGGARKKKQLQKQIARILAKRQNEKLNGQNDDFSDASSLYSEDICEAEKQQEAVRASEKKNDEINATKNNHATVPLQGTLGNGTQHSTGYRRRHYKESEVQKALKDEIHILDQTDCLQKYAYLYLEYNHKLYYWEFLKVVLRIMVAIILVFFHKDIYVKGVMVFSLVFVYGILTLKYQPYKLKSHQKLDLIGSAVICGSILGCIFLKDNEYSHWEAIVIALMSILNFGFVFIIASQIITTSIKKIIVEANNSKEKRMSIQQQKDSEQEIIVIKTENEKIQGSQEHKKQFEKNLAKIEELEKEICLLEYTYQVDAEGNEIEEDEDPFSVRFVGWVANKLRCFKALLGYPNQQTLDKVQDLSQRIKRWANDVFILGVLSGQVALQHEHDYDDYDQLEDKPYSAAYVLAGRLNEEQQKAIVEQNEVYYEQTGEWNSAILGHLVKLFAKRLEEMKFDRKYWDIDDGTNPQVVVNTTQNPINQTQNRIEQSQDNFLAVASDEEKVLASQLSDQISKKEILRHFEAFKLFETQHKGVIRKNDLSMILKTLGQNISRKDLNQMISEIDHDGNESIDLCEFLALIALKKVNVKHHEIAREMYQWYDLESDGQLGLREIKFMLKKLLKEDQTDDQIILEMIRKFDQDRDEQISYHEFLRIVT